MSTYFQNFVAAKSKTKILNTGGRVINPEERVIVRMLEERRQVAEIEPSLEPGEDGVRDLLERVLKPKIPNFTIINTKLFMVMYQLSRMGDFVEAVKRHEKNLYLIFDVKENQKHKFKEDLMIYYTHYRSKTEVIQESEDTPTPIPNEEDYDEEYMDDIEEEEYFMD